MKQARNIKDAGIDAAAPAFIDTPRGIFTASGIWFSTTESALREFAGPVLARVSLSELIRDAETWLRSAQALAIWVLPLFLYLAAPVPAALGALSVFVFWKAFSPAFASRSLGAVFRLLEKVWLQLPLYVIALSLLARQGHYAAVWTGLAGMIALRWSMVEKATYPLLKLIWRALYPLPIPDQVLRAFIIRAAVSHHLPLEEVDRIEEEIRAKWNRN